MTEQKFFDFNTEQKADWKARISKEQKGNKLDPGNSKLWDALDINLFYTKEDLPRAIQQTEFHAHSELPGTSPRTWFNIISVHPKEEKKDNQELLNALDNGAEGIALYIDGSENLNQLLHGVMTEYVQIYFIPLDQPALVLNQIRDWLETIHLKPSMLKGAFLWNPIDGLFLGNNDIAEDAGLVSEALDLFRNFPEFLPIGVDLAKYSDTGANGIQQLTFGLGEMIELVDHLVKRGVSARTLFEKSAFRLAVANAHFPEIAKLKAFRNLLKGLAHTFGVPLQLETIHLLVTTSTWSKSIVDEDTNLIRQTYEAMSAILGGANAVWVKPINEENASTLEKRIARNTSTILRDETYLDKVMDPAAGAFYLENLQFDIEELVIKELQKLEEEGGWKKSFDERALHQTIRSTRENAQKEVLENKEILVGVNKYKPSEKLAKRPKLNSVEEKEYELLPTRAAYLVELEILNKK